MYTVQELIKFNVAFFEEMIYNYDMTLDVAMLMSDIHICSRNLEDLTCLANNYNWAEKK